MWRWTHKRNVSWYFFVQTEWQRLRGANNFHFRAILSANMIYWTRARGATCSRLKYQREQDEMRRERILSKVRPAPRIFALLKLPWGMRGLETKTYQMTQKNSIFEASNYFPILKVILRPKEHYRAFPINYDDLLCTGQKHAFIIFVLEMSLVITYLGTLSKKENDIIWEFFPNVGRKKI